jgi:hypothetical protein
LIPRGGGFRLRDPLKLLFAWRDAYRFDRHERRGYFTLLQGNKLRDALANLDLETGGFTAYAAFSAADFQAPSRAAAQDLDLRRPRKILERRRISALGGPWNSSTRPMLSDERAAGI